MTMFVPDILETLMLICFSIGWYWSIFVMIWTRKPCGKSAAFVCFTVIGYMLGLAAQSADWISGEPPTYLMAMYAWNLAVTAIDLLLVAALTIQEKRPSDSILDRQARAAAE